MIPTKYELERFINKVMKDNNQITLLELSSRIVRYLEFKEPIYEITEKDIDKIITYAKYGMTEISLGRKDMVYIESKGNILKQMVKNRKPKAI